MDANYMRELVTKQELFVSRDRRLPVEWLARGKHAIAIAPQTDPVNEFLEAGVALDRFNPGTLFMSGGAGSGIAIMKRAPHPNAAKLFINWLMSQEGATFHCRAIKLQSQRLDVPTTHLPAEFVLRPGVKVFKSDTEEFTQKKSTVYKDLAKQIFGP